MTRLVPRRKRWREFPQEERRAMLALSAIVPVASAALLLFGYRRSLALAAWTADRWHASDVGALPLDRWALVSARVQRYSPLPGKCLSRSLGLWWLLRRRGCRCDLRLGVWRPPRLARMRGSSTKGVR